ncbi:NAD-dependent epimerase/dehydratase family protein [Pseudomonas sp. URMO17WK12:I12]|uniref:NAD-dependent epimerase/dehydratase family protein n=1 Tax=Pseudomonas sp. URMO17WK12:I12 TaxID=1259797 RepID=UPI000480A111|nr:NAD-dependent epimerase/dehydratase family protein [Pseudomonas sp. URMO17WK12:I12]
MKILVTGAGGFIGSALCKELSSQGMQVTALLRKWRDLGVGIQVVCGDLADSALVEEALKGIDVVVHLAGRAHQMKEVVSDPLLAFREVNRDLTIALAELSMKAGVKRFVFMSSIGVNGADTTAEPITEMSEANPVRQYAVSKFEAEQALSSLLKGKMEFVIIRPPLVYAANAPGNFKRLLRLVKLGVPLPFGKVAARRSMISLANLVSFIKVAMVHPNAADQLFLVSDGVDVSLPEVLESLALGMQRKLVLVPIPLGFLRFGSILLRKKMLYTQLCGYFLIDSSKAQTLLGWKAPFDVRSELSLAAKEFMIAGESGNVLY